MCSSPRQLHAVTNQKNTLILSFVPVVNALAGLLRPVASPFSISRQWFPLFVSFVVLVRRCVEERTTAEPPNDEFSDGHWPFTDQWSVASHAHSASQ